MHNLASYITIVSAQAIYIILTVLKHQVKRMYDIYKVNKLYSHRLHCKAIANSRRCQPLAMTVLSFSPANASIIGLRPVSNNIAWIYEHKIAMQSQCYTKFTKTCQHDKKRYLSPCLSSCPRPGFPLTRKIFVFTVVQNSTAYTLTRVTSTKS